MAAASSVVHGHASDFRAGHRSRLDGGGAALEPPIPTATKAGKITEKDEQARSTCRANRRWPYVLVWRTTPEAGTRFTECTAMPSPERSSSLTLNQYLNIDAFAATPPLQVASSGYNNHS